MSLVHRTPYRRLLEGKAKVGLAKARIVVPDGVAMAGYSLDGKVGRNAGDELWARALVVETLDGAERLAIVACDIMSASRALYEAALARLAGWAEASLIVCGTHTHTAPGRFYGNGFYDFFAQSLGDFPHFGFREDVCEAYADAVVGAVTAAWDGREAGTLAVGRVDLWGVARNRSYEAFEANYAGAGQHPRDWNEAADSPAPTPPAGLLPQGRASDPRLTTYAAWRDDGTLLGALGTFACHATALGPEHERYGRDWPGFAVGRAQAWLTPAGGETPLIAITGAAIGDQSPLPPDEPLPIDVDDHQGRGLARWVGYAVGEAVAASLEAAPTGTDPLTLRPRATRWAPAEDYGWDVGFATLAG
ncbi:MAG: neutral/alkaline non-lysosomal ceramidase N-terminal domain-containing protein, partial [Myxococcota bacterium]